MYYSLEACFGDPDDPVNCLKASVSKFPILNCELRLTVNGGLGVFATAFIPKDTELFKEIPLLAVPPDLTLGNLDDVRTAFQMLNTTDRQRIITLKAAPLKFRACCDDIDEKDKKKEKDMKKGKLVKPGIQKSGDDARSRKRARGPEKGESSNTQKGKARMREEDVEEDTGQVDAPAAPPWNTRKYRDAALLTTLEAHARHQGLYPTIARINHSCLPNYEAVGTIKLQSVYTRKDINPREEITLDHVPDHVHPAERLNFILEKWGVNCECPFHRGPDTERILANHFKIQRLARDFCFLTDQIILCLDHAPIVPFFPFPASVTVDPTDPALTHIVNSLDKFETLVRANGQRNSNLARYCAEAAALAKIIHNANPSQESLTRVSNLRKLASLPGVFVYRGNPDREILGQRLYGTFTEFEDLFPWARPIKYV